MAHRSFNSQLSTFSPWPVIAMVLVVTMVLLRLEGRLWLCDCGHILLWVGDTKSSNTSQHVFDPYSFTHILHGLVFYGLITWLFPQLPAVWRLALAITVEAVWEVVENSEFVIQRYREATIALGYQGDTIVNSLGDILCCAIGVLLAQWLGFRISLALFIITEVVLVVWIRDSLVLNIVMLLYPIPAIKAWQMGQ